MVSTPTPVLSKPGIRRDGTRLSSQAHTDGVWVRFSDGVARKIGGYRSLTRRLGGLSRGLHLGAANGVNYLHSGAADRLEQMQLLPGGTAAPLVARTPAGLVPDEHHVWSFDSIFDTVDGKWSLVAHAAPNALRIDSTVPGGVYIGDLSATAILTAVPDGGSDFAVSGGLCAVHPFMFYFGDSLIWSVSNKPGNVTSVSGTGTNIAAGEARPAGSKLIAGRSLRGLGVPGGLFWSLDTLIRGTYVGGAATWDFDTLAGIDILSPRSIVEYNGIYFWVGAGRFCMFSGSGVVDVPNPFNRAWFFDHLNKAYAARIFGFAIPERGEVWFCFPKDDATECNHAVILHVASGNWWDTPLPGGGRSVGLSPASTFPWPILSGVDEDDNQFTLWNHEFGLDEVDGDRAPRAIRSYFTTSDITLLRGDKPSLGSVQVLGLEPDFVQVGDMTVTVYGNSTSRAPTEIAAPVVISDPGTGVAEGLEVIELDNEHRQIRFRFESNCLGGDYEAGQTFAHITPVEGRVTG